MLNVEQGLKTISKDLPNINIAISTSSQRAASRLDSVCSSKFAKATVSQSIDDNPAKHGVS